VKTAIVIPAFNEEQSIGSVLDEIPPEHADEVIVVDNGSTDRTAAIAAERGATVLCEDRRGYGAACSKGIRHTGDGTDVIVILDADLSDYPDDLPGILQPIREGRADFVIGSRTMGRAEKGALPWNQRWGNALAVFLMRVVYGHRFTDMGPFRAIRRDHLLSYGMTDQTFGWNVEMQVKALMAGSRIVEVPVRYRPRVGKSKITGTVRGTVLAGTKIIMTIFKYYPAYVSSRRHRK
jgi:glycosyltransferase involved in cell wall biosynthesis